MKMFELQEVWQQGRIENKVYWTLMREGYTHILPEMQRMLAKSGDCEEIIISKEGCILRKKNGVKLYFDFTQAVCRAEADLVMGTDSEKDEMEFVNEVLMREKCKTVLDIGANVGVYSLDLYQKHKDMIYHVFEPIPETYKKLQATAELNGVDPANYITHNLGISDEQGILEFYLPAESEAASLMPVEDEFYRKKSTDMGEYTGEADVEKVLCKVDTVDHFVEVNGVEEIGFIKIDVEGNEKSVLAGGYKTIEKNQPLVYCELLRKHARRFGYHPNDVLEYMRNLGYCCATIRNGRLTMIDAINDATVETNFFFLHKTKHRGVLCNLVSL